MFPVYIKLYTMSATQNKSVSFLIDKKQVLAMLAVSCYAQYISQPPLDGLAVKFGANIDDRQRIKALNF